MFFFVFKVDSFPYFTNPKRLKMEASAQVFCMSLHLACCLLKTEAVSGFARSGLTVQVI